METATPHWNTSNNIPVKDFRGKEISLGVFGKYMNLPHNAKNQRIAEAVIDILQNASCIIPLIDGNEIYVKFDNNFVQNYAEVFVNKGIVTSLTMDSIQRWEMYRNARKDIETAIINPKYLYYFT